MEMQDVLIVVNGTRIKVEDAIVHLKAQGVFREIVCRLVEQEVVSTKSRELGIEISDAELYDFVSAKRRYAGLARAEDMNEYCRNNGITVEQWNKIARSELLLRKTRTQVVSEEAVLNYFNSNKEQMKMVSVSRIVSREADIANELKERVRNLSENFSDLARRDSIEENTRMAGGYLGTIRRGMLPRKVDDAIFSTEVNEVCGPFSENGRWTIYRVNGVREPRLDEALKKEIADRLFKAWLQQAIGNSKFEKAR